MYAHVVFRARSLRSVRASGARRHVTVPDCQVPLPQVRGGGSEAFWRFQSWIWFRF